MARDGSPGGSPPIANHSRGIRTNSPSPPAMPQSKRDKRRTALSDKLSQMVSSFSNNRHAHYTAQLSAIQCDINMVLRADPYSDGPLDDSSEGIARLIAETKEEVCRNRPLLKEAEESFAALGGSYYARFVDEVNKAIEERDRDLTMVYNRYQDGVDELHRRAQFQTQVARKEHELLADSIRERLIHTVSQKRAKLLKDKEQLDIADSNALLLNPSQFTIGHPSSPGGPHNNRKTRNTRLRPGEADDMVATAAASAAVQEGNKRKRKAQHDDDNVSPAPSTSRAAVDGTSTPYRDAKAKLIHAQFEAPAYSVERMFTEKELAMNLHRAHIEVNGDNASRREAEERNKARANGNGTASNGIKNGTSSTSKHDDNSATSVDVGGLNTDTAAAADPTSSAETAADADVVFHNQPQTDLLSLPNSTSTSLPTYHATRSTQRAAALTSTGNPLQDLANTAAAAALPPYVYPLVTTVGKNANTAAPPPIGLSDDKIASDLALMQRDLSDPLILQLAEQACVKEGRGSVETDVETDMNITAKRWAAAGPPESGVPSASASIAGSQFGSAPGSVAQSVGLGMGMGMGMAMAMGTGGVPMSKASSLGGLSEGMGLGYDGAMKRTLSATGTNGFGRR